MARIRSAVEELAIFDYPPVWLGEVGMTPEELLTLQDSSDALPEELRVKPGEFVSVEDDEGAGIQMPKVGYHYLEGLYVVQNMPEKMAPHEEEASPYLPSLVSISGVPKAKRGEPGR